MARKRRKLTTPEYEAELVAHMEQFRRVMREAEQRNEAYRKARAEELERRRRGWRRLIPFRRAA